MMAALYKRQYYGTNKAALDYLNRLAKHVISIGIQTNVDNLNVESPEYKRAYATYKKWCSNILRAYDAGRITEEEATWELCRMSGKEYRSRLTETESA